MNAFDAKLADERQCREWAEWRRDVDILSAEFNLDWLNNVRPGPSCACADRLREECATVGRCQEKA